MTQIVLNHITRMRSPRICVAGIDWDSGKHLRPVTTKDDLITRSLLAERGGPLQLGVCLELGKGTPMPNPPETEDFRCRTANFKACSVLESEEYLELLETVAAPDLTAAFGEELERDGRSYAMDSGKGKASLACVPAAGGERFALDDYGKLRLQTEEGASIGVTDARLFESDQKSVRSGLLDGINERLGNGVPAFMMFGLSRAFPKTGNRHWLQLNGICLADHPLRDKP